MAPSTPPEEIAQLMRFIAEKSKNVTSPMNVWEICKQFQEETGSLVSIMGLQNRIRFHRNRIHEMVEFNTETKVKMIFALSASIDTGFLIELKKLAEVKVDDQRRILEYKQKDGGLHLNFKNTNIKMMFLSNVKISDEFLRELREDADVEVDEKGRITKYKSNDGSLELDGSHRLSSTKKSFYSDRWKNICQNIDNDASGENGEEISNWHKAYEKKRIDLVRFLIERTKNAIFPLSIANLAKDYKTEFRSSDNLRAIESQIKKSFRQRIHTMNQFDIQTKVKLAFALSASINPDFLKELQKDAVVELDEKQRIKKYNAYDLSLNLEGDHSVSAKLRAGNAERKKKKARVFNDSSHSQDSEFAISQSPAAVPKGRKRAREDDGEPLKLEDDWSMDFDTKNADYYDYDPPSYELDMDHLPVEKKPESLLEVKTEEPEMPSTSISGDRYLFDYDPPTYEEDMDHIPEEKKPENLIEVKAENPDEPSTSNFDYHYEENVDNFVIEPKPEVFDKFE